MTLPRRRPPPRRPRTRALGLALALALAPAAALAAGSDAANEEAGRALGEALEAALGAPGLRGARVSALVVERGSGRTLFAEQAERALVPASNLKVLTALAALATFGPSHRFTTEVLAPAAPGEDGAVEALYLRGGGDPALTSERLWRLAADLRLRGLRRVAGPLVVDDAHFDAERWHPEWGKVSARAYHAPVGALAANYGAFRVVVTPGPEPGAPARVAVDPPVPYLRVESAARTVPPGTRRAGLVVEREAAGDRERVRVRGGIAAGSEAQSFWRSVARPARYAGAVARLQLEANGIAVEGPVRRGRAPGSATRLLAFEGAPLAEIVRLFVKNSNNFVAESLVKSIGARVAGAPGSWERGVPALRHVLQRLGLGGPGLRLVDGSGLAYENRLSARTLVEALRAADRSFAFGAELRAALPLAAADGTLEERADGARGRVRAKTGLLTRVTGLSGYARTAGGREVVFSLLANGYRRGDAAAMRAVDGFAAALAARGAGAQDGTARAPAKGAAAGGGAPRGP